MTYISFKVCFCEVLDYFDVILYQFHSGILLRQNGYLKGYFKVSFVPFEFKLISFGKFQSRDSVVEIVLILPHALF